MSTHDLEALEVNLEELRSTFDRVIQTDYEELIGYWRKPGWTTPAEYQLVSGILETMVQQAQTLERCKEILFVGCREIIAQAAQVEEPTAV
jgi:hypothetical protein